MRRLSLLATLSLLAMLVFSPAAFAQSEENDLDCSDFDTQEEAQAVYDQNTNDPNNLDADGDGVACESLPSGGGSGGTPAGGNGGTGTGGTTGDTSSDLDCADFANQATAQANLNANPNDPNGLDADDDGVACEEFNYENPDAGMIVDGNNSGNVTGDQYANGGQTTGGGMTNLPETGGPAMLLPVAAMLMVAGGLSLALLRRRQ